MKPGDVYLMKHKDDFPIMRTNIRVGDFVRCVERTETAAHLTGVYEVMEVRDDLLTLQNQALAYRANRFVLAKKPMSEDTTPYMTAHALPGSMQRAYQDWMGQTGLPSYDPFEIARAAFQAGWLARTGYPGPKVEDKIEVLRAQVAYMDKRPY